MSCEIQPPVAAACRDLALRRTDRGLHENTVTQSGNPARYPGLVVVNSSDSDACCSPELHFCFDHLIINFFTFHDSNTALLPLQPHITVHASKPLWGIANVCSSCYKSIL